MNEPTLRNMSASERENYARATLSADAPILEALAEANDHIDGLSTPRHLIEEALCLLPGDDEIPQTIGAGTSGEIRKLLNEALRTM